MTSGGNMICSRQSPFKSGSGTICSYLGNFWEYECIVFRVVNRGLELSSSRFELVNKTNF